MTDDTLEAIIAIAEEKSISKAAARLFISQPTLSRVLQKKEDELGELLFYRTSKGLIPTPAGEYFVSNARRIMKLYNDLDTEFCAVNNLHRGVLTFAAPTRLCSYILPDPLKRFHQLYPNVDIQIHDISGRGTEEEVIEAKTDLGFVYLPPKRHEVMVEPLFDISSVIIVPKDHPVNQKAYYSEKIHGYCMDVQELRDYDFILPASSTNSRRYADKVFKMADMIPDVRAEAVSLDIVIGLVAAGIGVSVIPLLSGLFYQRDIENISIYNLDEKYDRRNTVAMTYSGDNNLTTVTKEFMQILRETDWDSLFPKYYTAGRPGDDDAKIKQ